MGLETQMGQPDGMINERQLKKILSYVEIGKREGARLICGGERITDGELARAASCVPLCWPT